MTLKCSTWMQSQKQQNDLSLFPRQTIQHHSNPSLCPNHWCQSWMVLWRPTRPSRTNTKKDVLFIIGYWNVKVGSQEIPRITGKFGLELQNEAGQRLTRVLSREHASHSRHPFQRHERWLWLYTWTWPDGQYQNQIDYVLCSRRWRSSIQSAKTNLELTVAQIISSLLQNSGLNSRKHEKPRGHSHMT